MHDPDIVYAYEPNEFYALIRGAKHQQVDRMQFSIWEIQSNNYLSNKKGAKVTKVFNEKRLRADIEKDRDNSPVREQQKKAQKAEFSDLLRTANNDMREWMKQQKDKNKGA